MTFESLLSLIIWLCLTRTGNYSIHARVWLADSGFNFKMTYNSCMRGHVFFFWAGRWPSAVFQLDRGLMSDWLYCCEIHITRHFSRTVTFHLHVTFHGENTIIDSFRWHPPHWKSVMLTGPAIHILFHGASSQTKISYFDEFLFADQDIASGDIPMNNILSWQVSLRKKHRK